MNTTMTKLTTASRALLPLCALLMLLLPATSATAREGRDIQLPVQGVLVERDGAQPLQGEQTLTFRLYSLGEDEVMGEPVWARSRSVSFQDDGSFHVYLGEQQAIASTLFAQGGDLALSVQVQGDEESAPVLLGRVPYAAWADHAADANTIEGLSVNTLLARVPAPTAGNVTYNDPESELGGARTTQAAIEALVTRLNALEADNLTLRMELAAVETSQQMQATQLAALTTRVTNDEAALGQLATRTQTLETKTASLSVQGDELFFTGVNVNVRSGAQSRVNGKGNLIIGYNNNASPTRVRTGSHNLVIGQQHTYSGEYGLVTGYDNKITNVGAVVLGGYLNEASGRHSALLGGTQNKATGLATTVSGGQANTAAAENSSIAGGENLTTTAAYISRMRAVGYVSVNP